MTDLRTKLRIVEGARVCLLRIPDRHVPLLGPIERVDAGAGVVVLYSRTREQLDRDAPAAIRALTDGGVLWICHPKLSAKTPSDLSREVVREAMAAHARRAVSQVAVDDTWSALRFTPES